MKKKMPTVVIIGFGYDSNPTEGLPSTITDIYRVFSFYRDLNYKIYVASDIERPLKPNSVIELLTSDTIDDKYLPFVSNDFVKIRKLVRSEFELKMFLSSIEPTDDARLIFYYTGHGQDGSLILPNGYEYPAVDLREDILKINRNSMVGNSCGPGEIFIILDCCNPHGLYLPFKLDRIRKKYTEMNQHHILSEIILLSSSEPTKKSAASLSESFFTRYLFSRLRNRIESYDLLEVMNYIDREINMDQCCSAYASYSTLIVPWTWIVTDKIDLRVNNEIDALIVKTGATGFRPNTYI